MKKKFLLVFPMIFCFISLSAQLEKKDPLIVVNGKISNTKLSSLQPSDIESMNLTKSKANLDAYGVLAENGVISIITKDFVKIANQKDQLSEKLVLVDGVVYTSSLDSINVQEIESLDLRPGIWGTKHYGKAGENGVITIITKKNTLNKK